MLTESWQSSPKIQQFFLVVETHQTSRKQWTRNIIFSQLFWLFDARKTTLMECFYINAINEYNMEYDLWLERHVSKFSIFHKGMQPFRLLASCPIGCSSAQNRDPPHVGRCWPLEKQSYTTKILFLPPIVGQQFLIISELILRCQIYYYHLLN